MSLSYKRKKGVSGVTAWGIRQRDVSKRARARVRLRTSPIYVDVIRDAGRVSSSLFTKDMSINP